MAQLLDQYGNPIDTSRLTEEEAGPTVAGVRQVISDHPWQGMTPRRLGQVMLAAEEGDADAYLEVAEEIEEKDLHYRAVMGTRKLQVSQLPVTVEAASDEPADQEDADFVREHLVDTGVVSDYLFDQLDALGKGYSVGEIIWKRDLLWLPTRIEWRDPRWFEFARDGRTLLLKGGVTGIGAAEPLKPYGYVVHYHKTKSGLPIRGGLARPAAWLILFKVFDVKSWVEFLEGFGQPVRLGKYKPGASKEDKAALLRAVRSMWKDSAAIIPDSMLVEWLEAKVTGNTTLQQDFADWVDRQVSKLVLGQTGTTDVGQHVGTAKAHDKVKDDIERDDGKQSANSINDCLVRPTIDLNRGPRKRYPRVKIERPDAVDLKLYMETVEKFVNLGGRVEASVVGDKIGLPDAPEAGKDGKQVYLLRPAGTAQPKLAGDAGTGSDLVDLSTANQRPDAGSDPIDDIEQTGLDGWEEQMAPMIDPVRALIDGASSYEEAIAGLKGLKMDNTRLVEALTKAMFLSRAAGDQVD
ncbi:MAG TPA: DUF935 domain-containing protein [Azospirillum sp.]|nr:DUF935 domain-containing protein [Azospirillum sp.]